MTTLEAYRQTVDIEEIKRQVKRRRVGKADETKEKPNYLGVCFFDGYGNAWLDIDGDTRCIGKEKDVREACKKYNTDVENPSDVKNTMIRWRREGWDLSTPSSDVAKCEISTTEKTQSRHYIKSTTGLDVRILKLHQRSHMTPQGMPEAMVNRWFLNVKKSNWF
jgi:hypothetical protein